MQYGIDTVEVRTAKTSGKEYKSVTLKSGDETFERVSVWPDYPGYDAVVEGGILSGEVFKKGEYWNFRGLNAKPSYAGKSSAVTKAMDRKEESIEKFQDNKEMSIRLMAAQRDAVLMVTTFEANTPFPTDTALKAKFVEWREYFLAEANSRGKLPF